MTTRLLLLAAVLLPCALPAQEPAPINHAIARSYFEEVLELGTKDHGSLWGRQLPGPMLFVDPSSGYVVANRADPAGSFTSVDGLWIGRLPKGIHPANTAVDIGGMRWAMIMWPVSDNRYTRRRLLMHESFHRIQDSLGIPGTNPGNSHLASADGRIWLRLEFRALTEALLASGEQRRTALRDALTFRAKRHSLSSTAAEEERQLELNEGLAEYTGYVLSGLPGSVLADRAAVQLSQQEVQESQSRSFAYASGPAYALLLDATSRSWKRSLTRSSDLSTLAARAYGLNNISGNGAESLISRYTAERMIAVERGKEAARLAEEVRLKARYASAETLSLPIAGKLNFSFDPNGAVPLPGLGTHYASSKISDEWGSLDVSGGGVLFVTSDGKISGLIVAQPMSKDGRFAGDGWTLTLNPGWSVRPSPEKGGRLVVSRE